MRTPGPATGLRLIQGKVLARDFRKGLNGVEILISLLWFGDEECFEDVIRSLEIIRD